MEIYWDPLEEEERSLRSVLVLELCLLQMYNFAQRQQCLNLFGKILLMEEVPPPQLW